MEHDPIWLPRVLVDAMHYAQLDEHGGAHGLRDANALEAALARPRQKQAYDSRVDLADLAAAYSFALARSHPYTDGNKRVAFVAAAVFLELNGYEARHAGHALHPRTAARAAGVRTSARSRISSSASTRAPSAVNL